MSYSPVSHKRPYTYDSPISNHSTEYSSYPNSYPSTPSHSMHNPPLGPQYARSYSQVHPGSSKSYPSSQAPPPESYRYSFPANVPLQQPHVTSNKHYEESIGGTGGYPLTFSTKESSQASEPQFRLSSNHYLEISNRCDEIIGILSKFDRSDIGDTNQLVDSARALYDVFLSAEQKLSPNRSPAPSKSSEKPKKRTKTNQTKLYCHSCNCTDTPEWRKGPLGPRTLCNACGLIWAKLSKKKAKEAQMTSKNGKHESELSDSRSNSGSTAIDNTRSRSAEDTPPQPTESKDEKVDDKKLTLSFLLS